MDLFCFVSQDLLGLYFDLQCGSTHVEEVLRQLYNSKWRFDKLLCCGFSYVEVFFYRFSHHKLYKNRSDFRDVLGFRNF